MAYYPNYNQGYNPYQIQNGGFVRVQTEEEARRYPVAPGYSVTFIDETAEHCYTKTAGFSQFDQPVFKKYRLIAENEPQRAVSNEGNIDTPEYATKAEYEALRSEFEAFKRELTGDE